MAVWVCLRPSSICVPSAGAVQLLGLCSSWRVCRYTYFPRIHTVVFVYPIQKIHQYLLRTSRSVNLVTRRLLVPLLLLTV
jgi:hypothetical protein